MGRSRDETKKREVEKAIELKERLRQEKAEHDVRNAGKALEEAIARRRDKDAASSSDREMEKQAAWKKCAECVKRIKDGVHGYDSALSAGLDVAQLAVYLAEALSYYNLGTMGIRFAWSILKQNAQEGQLGKFKNQEGFQELVNQKLPNVELPSFEGMIKLNDEGQLLLDDYANSLVRADGLPVEDDVKDQLKAIFETFHFEDWLEKKGVAYNRQDHSLRHKTDGRKVEPEEFDKMVKDPGEGFNPFFETLHGGLKFTPRN